MWIDEDDMDEEECNESEFSVYPANDNDGE